MSSAEPAPTQKPRKKSKKRGKPRVETAKTSFVATPWNAPLGAAAVQGPAADEPPKVSGHQWLVAAFACFAGAFAAWMVLNDALARLVAQVLVAVGVAIIGDRAFAAAKGRDWWLSRRGLGWSLLRISVALVGLLAIGAGLLAAMILAARLNRS